MHLYRGGKDIGPDYQKKAPLSTVSTGEDGFIFPAETVCALTRASIQKTL